MPHLSVSNQGLRAHSPAPRREGLVISRVRLGCRPGGGMTKGSVSPAGRVCIFSGDNLILDQLWATALGDGESFFPAPKVCRTSTRLESSERRKRTESRVAVTEVKETKKLGTQAELLSVGGALCGTLDL